MTTKNAKYIIDLSRLKSIVNPWAWPLFGDKHRHLVLQGGAGSGKSVFASQKIVVRCIVEPGHHFCCFRKVASSVRMSIWMELLNSIEATGTSALWHENKTESTLTFLPNGSKIRCLGLDDPEKLKSISGMTGAWLEEATEFTEADLKQINLRLRGHTPSYKQIIITFNPINILHWLKARFVDKLDPNRDLVVKTTFRDNQFIDEEYAAELATYKVSDPYIWKVYGMGDWGHSEGLIYRYPYTMPRDLMPPESAFEEVIRGLDWGYNNPTALVKVMVRPTPGLMHLWYRSLTHPPSWLSELFAKKASWLNEELFPHLAFITTEVYEEKLTTPQLVERMKKGNIQYWEKIYADPAQPGSIQELVNEGFNVIPAEKGQGSIFGGVKFCQSKTLVVPETDIEILKEFGTYHWKQNKEKMTDEPVDAFNHGMDAFRYALWTNGLETGEIPRLRRS